MSSEIGRRYVINSNPTVYHLQNTDVNMDNFVIRAYSKKELTLDYFPTASTPHAAVNHLMAWIKRCTELYDSLVEIGYQKNAKYFTPREVLLIVKFLGEPTKIYE